MTNDDGIIKPLAGVNYDETVTLCQVCHDFKLCFDFGEDWHERLPSVVCEECLNNCNILQDSSSKERREILIDLMFKSGHDIEEVNILSREISTFPIKRLESTMEKTLQDLFKSSKKFPFPFEIDNTPKPEIRLAIRKKQASMAIMIFLLQEELRARTEVSNEGKAD